MTYIAWALVWLSTCTGSVQISNPTSGPVELHVEFIQFPGHVEICDPFPEFGWTVPASCHEQSAYQVLVATSVQRLNEKDADCWNSGKIESKQCSNIEFQGGTLKEKANFFWKVRIWGENESFSEYSDVQEFRTGLFDAYCTTADRIESAFIRPVQSKEKKHGHYFFDFGRAAAGTVEFTVNTPFAGSEIVIRLGEKLAGADSIDQKPGGSIRYREEKLVLGKGLNDYKVTISPDLHNTGKRTLKMDSEVGEVIPFRYCELVNMPSGFDTSSIRQVAVNYRFNDEASSFFSSDQLLDSIWNLCKHSIKATSYCGLYIDGDRERFPREADSYINQLSHYAVDREYTLARRTHEFMLTHTSQWTEWILHSIFMAWQDYMYTGNSESLEQYYDLLKEKALLHLTRDDGLISTKSGLVDDNLRKRIYYFEGEHIRGKALRDIVDWPAGERDGYVFDTINTVVNSFHFQALKYMSDIAAVLSKESDSRMFGDRAALVKKSINRKLFDFENEVYRDGENVAHASLHANMFALAFGIVPDEYMESVVQFIKSKGMACSVYGAQYLLESLYRAGEEDYAFSLLTSRADRSWFNMMHEGSTISLEAWGKAFKKNLDWNHAWGAAPANIIRRYIMGVRPVEPGFSKVLIRPQPGSLASASAKIPSIRGDIYVAFNHTRGEEFLLEIEIPSNMSACVEIGLGNKEAKRLYLDKEVIHAEKNGDFLQIDNVNPGKHIFKLIY